MSLRALLLVLGRKGLTPPVRLTLIYLADAHHDVTGQCNPSPELLAERTGLSTTQVRSALRKLEASGLIQRGMLEGWRIEGVEDLGKPAIVPKDWWPDEGTIAHLVGSYPSHYFSISEAVREFVRYHRAERRLVAPGALNARFFQNVSALLDHRSPGEVQIAGEGDGSGAPGLRDRLLGLDRPAEGG